MKTNKSFSDRLTPAQIQQVLDSLGIHWRESFNSDNDGWVNLPHDDFLSDLSVNVINGGWKDQYYSGGINKNEDRPVKGDIVQLVSILAYQPNQAAKAIKYIKDVCGINDGKKPPDVPVGFDFANEWLGRDDTRFVRLPMEILGSKLTSSQKLVWCAIFSRCNKGDIYSFPSIRRIAEDTNLAKSTVQTAIADLIKYGLIIKKPRGENKAHARFPLVASKELINSRVSATSAKGVFGIQYSPVRYSVQECSVFSTELEPYNYNHNNYNQMLQGETYNFPVFAVLFLSLNKTYSDRYGKLLKRVGRTYVIDRVYSN